jgi:hypothetical protein
MSGKITLVGEINNFNLKTDPLTSKTTIQLEGKFDSVNDGYHTVSELYAHRMLLFIALIKHNKEISWKSRLNSDGNCWEGLFVAGIDFPSVGQITYHITNNFWNMLDDISTIEKAKWDGHSPDDVIIRLNNYGYLNNMTPD